MMTAMCRGIDSLQTSEKSKGVSFDMGFIWKKINKKFIPLFNTFWKNSRFRISKNSRLKTEAKTTLPKRKNNILPTWANVSWKRSSSWLPIPKPWVVSLSSWSHSWFTRASFASDDSTDVERKATDGRTIFVLITAIDDSERGSRYLPCKKNYTSKRTLAFPCTPKPCQIYHPPTAH